ncbi:hypothetical protein AN189_02990 [Loktanella sp. 3ANDIMAR09]|uniref:hypothetical protein n=1 Tax=Loktanella sp. 3ANDIMAR09 TaxID=1225657 RepID=UPI0006F3EF4A|nr:hypothetical protein [Loktanella sp. 3ANDIMAR09]KQI69403.1 hypothetical protein AN189_02990 [Loktanella sp. 3ANDIMAR09]
MSGSAKNQNALFVLFEAGSVHSVAELAEASGISLHETIKTAGYLVNRGYLSRTETGVFTLTDEGIAAQAEGTVITSGPKGPDTGLGRKPFADTLRQRAWCAMRFCGVFSTAEIVEVAADEPTEKDHANVRRYCRGLCDAGFLMDMPTRARGASETSNGFKRYRLFKDTGEIAPTYRNTRKEVFDHNTREVFPCQM